LLCTAVALGVLASAFHPRAQETEESQPSSVSEADVERYIAVYSAMQDDHDLNIDQALKPYDLTLDEFRSTERRIQGESRLVERVRAALLDHAKGRALFAQAAETQTPVPAPSATPERKSKKKPRDRKN